MGEESESASRVIEVQASSEAGLEALEMEYKHVLDRIEHQHDVLKEFSREGMKMFRIMILFFAIPATVIGAFSLDTLLNFGDFLLSSKTAISFFSDEGFTHGHVFVSTGVFAILSIAFHIPATGQEFKGIRNQTNPNDISLLIDHNLTEESYLRMKLELLRDRIEENRKTLKVMEDFLAVGKVFTLLTVGGVGILFYNIATGRPISVLVLLVALAFILWVMQKLPSNYTRSDRFFVEEDPFDDEYNVEVID